MEKKRSSIMFFIPLERENPVRHTPWAVYSLIGAYLLIFFVQLCVPASPWRPDYILRSHNPSLPLHDAFASFASLFIHGGFFHLLMSIFFLWMFGDNIEDVTGPLLFLLIYILGGMWSTWCGHIFNIDSLLLFPGPGSAISGVAGAYLILFFHTRTDLLIYFFEIRIIKMPAYGLIMLWFFFQFGLALFYRLFPTGSYLPISFREEAAGFLSGMLIGFILLFLRFKKRYDDHSRRHFLFGYAR